tara:strand:- start:806 stop:1639 length:834 start_codon:yes stop_codon:yes gene_type:complete
MNSINIYLAHRSDTKFMEQQVNLIRKYFKHSSNSKLCIYGFVDCPNNPKLMHDIWKSLDVIPIIIPQEINGVNRSNMSPSDSFGYAFEYVYINYILKDNYISVFLENDVFPFKDIDIEKYVDNYEICGEVRFNAKFLPVRINHFWLGFIIFNHKEMTDRDKFSGLRMDVKPYGINKTYWTDCGAKSYYWITEKQRKIRQMVTNGNEDYDGFTSLECTPHNITTDVENLPDLFREKYDPNYRVLIYDDCLLHLERMGKEAQSNKFNWWLNCYNKIIKK